MTESRPSKAQEQFLKNEKRHHLLVGSARFLVFFLFAGLWELSADLGVIDSFIFSSPSRIALWRVWNTQHPWQIQPERGHMNC